MRLLHVLPVVAVSCISSLAMAESNTSQINQTGEGHTVQLQQIGNANQAVQKQEGMYGNQIIQQYGGGNTATIDQNSTSDQTHGYIFQSGDNNISTFENQDSAPLILDQMGDSNKFSHTTSEGAKGGGGVIYQEGANNIQQITKTGSESASAYISQKGTANTVTLDQNTVGAGEGSGISVSQQGENNFVAATQNQMGADAAINQSGYANTAALYQDGLIAVDTLAGHTTAILTQTGIFNTADITQFKNAEANLIQGGNNNSLRAEQFGQDTSSNSTQTKLTSTQTGDGNTLASYQSDLAGINEITTIQGGIDNSLSVSQLATTNSSMELTQIGYANEMRVSQVNTTNDSIILVQDGNDLSISFESLGEGNQAVINQTGVYNALRLVQQ